MFLRKFLQQAKPRETSAPQANIALQDTWVPHLGQGLGFAPPFLDVECPYCTVSSARSPAVMVTVLSFELLSNICETTA